MKTKSLCSILGLVLSMFLLTSCKDNEEDLFPQYQEQAVAQEEASAGGCPANDLQNANVALRGFFKARGQICPNSSAADNKYTCGCSIINGLSARKKLYWDAGLAVTNAENVKDFLAKAMLEESTMNPANYPYGDVYPKDATEPWATRDRKKVGYAANGGAIKQNVFVIAATCPGRSGTVVTNYKFDPNIMTTNGVQKGDFVPTACPATATCWNEIVDALNNNPSWDIVRFVESRARFRVLFNKATDFAGGDDPWTRAHRGGSSYLTREFVDAKAGGTQKTGTNIYGTNWVFVNANTTDINVLVPEGNKYLTDGGWSIKSEAYAKSDTRVYQTAVDWIENNLFYPYNGNQQSAAMSNFPNMYNNWRFWANVPNI